MKTLFLKDSKLFIRLKDGGEYEVSNPEILFIDDKIPEDEQQLFLAHCMLNGIEYPGDVEIITIDPHPDCSRNQECLHEVDGLNCTQRYKSRLTDNNGCAKRYKLVKLLPKKEKEPFVKALEDAQDVKNLQVSNSAHSFTESNHTTQITTCAGKFVNGFCDRCGKPPFTTGNFATCGRWINPPYIQEIKGTIGPSRGTRPDVIVESSEPQEKKCRCFDPKECMQFGCQFPESVPPSETQEEPILFADWLIKNGWEPQMTEGLWIQYAEEPIMKGSSELYKEFLTRK